MTPQSDQMRSRRAAIPKLPTGDNAAVSSNPKMRYDGIHQMAKPEGSITTGTSSPTFRTRAQHRLSSATTTDDADDPLWFQFARACWNCGRVQTTLPEHWLCGACRNEDDGQARNGPGNG